VPSLGCKVYLADQQTGKRAGVGSTVRRAVKLIRHGAAAADYADFVSETAVMLGLEHTNLVGLVGVAVQQRPWLMVLEYCELGDLQRILKGCTAKGITLDVAEQLRIATQICDGMEYMASKRVIHMDLAARNVLMAAENLCKVADFGMSKQLPAGADSWTSPSVLQLAVKWCAVESLDNRIFSVKSDVWAFGVTLWEIASYGITPYQGVKPNQIHRKIREGLRLTKPAGCTPSLFSMMQTCFAAAPEDRPSFGMINSVRQPLFLLFLFVFETCGALIV
jgi:serine/threonine protein kinase